MSAKARRLSERITIDPDAVPPAPTQSAEPIARLEPVPEETPAAEISQTPVPAMPRQAGEWRTCLDDPAILDGRANYRSFYVEDTVFARYRAAVYWCARLADAEGLVGENMSVDVQKHMSEVARVLEDKFNNGEPFRPTPEQIKKPRRKRRTKPVNNEN
jgi:hypothetical protein